MTTYLLIPAKNLLTTISGEIFEKPKAEKRGRK